MKNTAYKEKLIYGSLAFAGLACFVVLWWVISRALAKPFILPTPLQVVRALAALFLHDDLFGNALASVSRILTSFIISCAFAIPIGIMLGISKRFSAVIEPLIGFIRYIPPSAFIPLAIIWFGIGAGEKIVVLVLGVAPYLALLIADLVLNTRHELVDAALTLGASRGAMVARVIIPHALPGMWDAFRVMVGSAWTYLIIAEMVGASLGLGHLMIEAQRFLRTDTVFASMLAIGTVGLITDYSFKCAYGRLFPWSEKSYARN